MSLLLSGLHTLIGLIVIVNPLLGVSAIATLTAGDSRAHRALTARYAAMTIAVVLIVSALAGEFLLALFGISIPEFKVGGGILILLMAIAMLNASPGNTRQTPEEQSEAHDKRQVGVVPLGIPLLAGPGAISAAIIYAQKSGGPLGMTVLLVDILIVALLTWLAMRSSDFLTSFIGQTGLNIATRIMGLILSAIAIGFIASGLLVLFPVLGSPAH
ncbi:MarC family protein [Solimonas variicoloris]|uniref:MarC family protein n=1 Tax=Solimonas variicoloris TaxID=254408 RepID=UPI0003612CF2|nr:NAAT family transporter [Solimonas variicoloris]